MKNTKNNNSINVWAGLFDQSDVSLSFVQNKTHVTHLYPRDHIESCNVFRHLFHDTENKQKQQQFEKKAALMHWLDKAFSSKITASETSKSALVPNFTREQAGSTKVDLSFSPKLNGEFTVLNCFTETPDVKTFRLVPDNERVFDYLPGQYVRLTLDGDKRFYSLASSPSRPNCIEITVKRDRQGGMVSNWLHDQLKKGDKLQLSGPYGHFTCANPSCDKLLFIAAGSGVVPIMSMLRWLTDTNACIDLVLLLSFRNQQEIIYRHELEFIAARYAYVKVIITLTGHLNSSQAWHGLTGRVSETMIAVQVPDLTKRDIYLCGPEAFMAQCKKFLLKLKHPDEKLFCESFTVNSPLKKPARAGFIRAATSETGNFKVRLARSGKTMIVDSRMTLLEGIETAGIIIASECGKGECGTCMVKCLEGKVEMMAGPEIDDHDKDKGWVYACCSYPLSDVVLDI